jgi:hypothetical protein
MMDKIASTSAVIMIAAFMGLMAITTPEGMFAAAGNVVVDIEQWWTEAPTADTRANADDFDDPARKALKAGFHAGWGKSVPTSLDPMAEPASWVEGYYDGFANGRVARDEHNADKLAEFDQDMLRPSIEP